MTIFSGILNLIYPIVCLNCGSSLVQNESIICVLCFKKLPLTYFHDDPSNPMIKALWGRVNICFATAFLYFTKGGITQKILHNLKYKSREDIGLKFGYWFGKQIIHNAFIQDLDYLIPVPLHPKKLKIRGYNQSRLLCLGLSKALNVPICDCLERIHFTDTQTRKRRIERWFNVSEKFTVNNTLELKGKKVLIIDDVFTTGATLDSCCKAFDEIEELQIGVATLGFAKI